MIIQEEIQVVLFKEILHIVLVKLHFEHKQITTHHFFH